VAVPSVNDLITVMSQVVDRHMREHPELEATPEAVAALQALIVAAAQRLAGDPALADQRSIGVANTQVLMDASHRDHPGSNRCDHRGNRHRPSGGDRTGGVRRGGARLPACGRSAPQRNDDRDPGGGVWRRTQPGKC